LRQPDPQRRATARPFFAPSIRAILVCSIGAALVLAGGLTAVRSARARAAGFPGARWIWISAAPEHAPVHFSAIREFSLSALPSGAIARIFVDRRFEFRVNGSYAGSGTGRPGGPFASFEVCPLLRSGRNSVAVVAESADGVGAILFAMVDERGRPIVVSDGRWTVDPTGASVSAPGPDPVGVLGTPPRYPWWNVASAGRALWPAATGARLARMRARPGA
jgi:hypothetical protein